MYQKRIYPNKIFLLALKFLQTILNFEQISRNLFELPDGKIFQDDRDPDLNYFGETNVQIRKRRTHFRVRIISVLHVNIRGLKNNSENVRDLMNNTILVLLLILFFYGNMEM